MPDIKKLLGKRIKELRIAKNMTQEELSEYTGIGNSSISKIESGHFHPTAENLEKISEALGVETYQLYFYKHHEEMQNIRKELSAPLQVAKDEDLKLIYRIVLAIFNK